MHRHLKEFVSTRFVFTLKNMAYRKSSHVPHRVVSGLKNCFLLLKRETLFLNIPPWTLFFKMLLCHPENLNIIIVFFFFCIVIFSKVVKKSKSNTCVLIIITEIRPFYKVRVFLVELCFWKKIITFVTLSPTKMDKLK